MRDTVDQAIFYVQTSLPEFVVIFVLGAVMLSITLAFLGKVVFYADYNDLSICAAMFGLPALIIVLSMFWTGTISEGILILAAVVFVPLFFVATLTTWRSNRSIWKTVIVMFGKTTLSFLYIFHLFDALTAKNRSKRGISWFVLAILTPLMYALVADKQGKRPSLRRRGM